MDEIDDDRGDLFGRCAVCGQEYEARSAEEARELHDAYEDHEFVAQQTDDVK